MIRTILVSGLLALVAFKSAQTYREYRSFSAAADSFAAACIASDEQPCVTVLPEWVISFCGELR